MDRGPACSGGQQVHRRDAARLHALPARGLRGSDVVRLGPTMSTHFRDAMPSRSRRRNASAMSGVRSCQHWRRKWRHGSGDRVRTCCSRTQAVHAQGIRQAVRRGARCDPQLKGLTLHGLRATAVMNLRRAGLCMRRSANVGMSAKMVEHYCRNADMRSNSRAALTHLERAMAR